MNEYDKFVDFMFKNLTPEDIECLKECKKDENLYIPLAFFADDDTVNELVCARKS